MAAAAAAAPGKQAGRQAGKQARKHPRIHVKETFSGAGKAALGEKQARSGREAGVRGGPSLLEEKPFEALTRHRRGWPAPEHHAAPDPVLVQKKKQEQQ